ncbi:sporulation protein YqfD [Bacillus sp. RG28]|uniref:Sporulation protein YqfD n=1 Tax=Gottfriedia endophytica TaxID=2820819 RepID=A0A940SIW2_9BACI|nr:sporulation protein YqfD [Gottfriedia endophytica]MBP0723588.1 sporulation protein YqfD [Gottfriedia endophytica]
MRNNWTSKITGIVQVKVTGIGPERYLNDCMRKGIPLKDIKKVGEQCILFKIELTDLKRLRKIPRKKIYKVEFLSRKGFPFQLKRAIKHIGFVTGILTFVSLLFILSNMVWKIEIVGASPSVEYKVMKELNSMGIKRGVTQYSIPKLQEIQKKLQDKIPSITWVGVKLYGTTFHFQVVEKKLPKPDPILKPQHIVAKEKAIVTGMYVEKGKPLVTINDFVHKGQILVSGLLGTEENPIPVPAVGEIMGEVWREEYVTVPIHTNFQLLSGKSKRNYFIRIGKMKIKYWGFDKNTFKRYKDEKQEYQIKFLKWKLPIYLAKNTQFESKEVTRTYTKEDAKEVALKIGRKDVMKDLDKDAKILSEKVLHESIDNGKVNIRIFYKINEVISKPQTIVQGD